MEYLQYTLHVTQKYNMHAIAVLPLRRLFFGLYCSEADSRCIATEQT